MHLRPTSSSDYGAVDELHERSVRELAASEYDDAVVEAWTSLSDDADDEDSGDGGDDGEDEAGDDGQPDNGHRVVAELAPPDAASVPDSLLNASAHDGAAVAGFGDVRFEPPEYLSEPADGGIRAVYVDPAFAGMGVGSRLLEHLEATARGRNLDSLGLLASVNAEGFYAHHGYEVVAETTFEFGPDVEGPAVELRTEL